MSAIKPIPNISIERRCTMHYTFNLIKYQELRISLSSSQNSFPAHPQPIASEFRFSLVFCIITVSLCLVFRSSQIVLRQTVSLSIKYNLVLNLFIEPIYKLAFTFSNYEFAGHATGNLDCSCIILYLERNTPYVSK